MKNKNSIKHVIVLQDVSSKLFLAFRDPLPFRCDRLDTLAHAWLFRNQVAALKMAKHFNDRLRGTGLKKRYVVRSVPRATYERAEFYSVGLARKAL